MCDSFRYLTWNYVQIIFRHRKFLCDDYRQIYRTIIFVSSGSEPASTYEGPRDWAHLPLLVLAGLAQGVYAVRLFQLAVEDDTVVARAV
jgi:hypothetical protein